MVLSFDGAKPNPRSDVADEADGAVPMRSISIIKMTA